MFQPPGGLTELSENLLNIWNKHIQDQITRQFSNGLGSRFFVRNPTDITSGQISNSVKWGAAPAEPGFCLDKLWAQRLSDWGTRGRHETHNEYCEYLTYYKLDSTGRIRPKRVDFTSELREYWLLMAEYEPDTLKLAAKDVLGKAPTWTELYGQSDPKRLTPQQRKIAFGMMVAGHGKDQEMMNAGVPEQPNGAINTNNLLFMTHPINGLDDLILCRDVRSQTLSCN